MQEFQTIPDLYKAFDSIEKLSDTLLKVQSGEHWGIFSLETMKPVVPIECSDVVPIGAGRFRVIMQERSGTFSLQKEELSWD